MAKDKEESIQKGGNQRKSLMVFQRTKKKEDGEPNRLKSKRKGSKKVGIGGSILTKEERNGVSKINKPQKTNGQQLKISSS